MSFIISGLKSFSKKATSVVGSISSGLDDAAKISAAIHQALSDVNKVIQGIGNSYDDYVTAADADGLLGQMRTLATIGRAADLNLAFPERRTDLQAMTKGQLVDFLNAASDALTMKASRIPLEFSQMSNQYAAGDIDVYNKYRAALSDRLSPSTVTDYDQIWNRAVKIRSAKLGDMVNAGPAQQLAVIKSANTGWQTMASALNNRIAKVPAAAAAGESRMTEIGFTTVPLSPNGIKKGNGLQCEPAYLPINSRVQPALRTGLDTTVYEAKLPSGSVSDVYGTVTDTYDVMTAQYNKLKLASYDPSVEIGLSGRFALERASQQLSFQEHMVPTANFTFSGISEKVVLLGEAHFHRNETFETRTDATIIQSAIKLAGNMAILHPDAAHGLVASDSTVLPDLIDVHSMRTCDVPGENFLVTDSPNDDIPTRFDGVAMLISLSKNDYARGVLTSAKVRQISDVTWELESYIRGKSEVVLNETVSMVDGDIFDANTGRMMIKMGCGYDQMVGRSMKLDVQSVSALGIPNMPSAGTAPQLDINELIPSNSFGTSSFAMTVGACTMPIATSADASVINGSNGVQTTALAVPAFYNDGTIMPYYALNTHGLRDKRVDACVATGHFDANHHCGKAVIRQMTHGTELTLDASPAVAIVGTNGTNVGHSSLAAAVYRLESPQALVCERAANEVLMVWVFPDPSASFDVAEANSIVLSEDQAETLTTALVPNIAGSIAAPSRDGYADLNGVVPSLMPTPTNGDVGTWPEPGFAPIFASGLGRPPNAVVTLPSPETVHTPGGVISGYSTSAAYGGRIVFGALPLAQSMARKQRVLTIATPDIGADVILAATYPTLTEGLVASATRFPAVGYQNAPKGTGIRIYEARERKRQVSYYGPMFKRYGIMAPLQFAYGHIIPTLPYSTEAYPGPWPDTRALQAVTLETGANTFVSLEKTGMAWFYRGGEYKASSRECPSTFAPDRAAALMLMRRDASSEVAIQKMKTPVPSTTNLSGVFNVEQKDGSIRPEWHEIVGTLEEAIQAFGPLNRSAIGFGSAGLSASIGTGTIYSALKRSVDNDNWKELVRLYADAQLPGALPLDPEALYYLPTEDFQQFADGLALIGTTSAKI